MKSILPLFAIALACASCAGESSSSATAGAPAAVSAAQSPAPSPADMTLEEPAGASQADSAQAGDQGRAGRPHHTEAAPAPLLGRAGRPHPTPAAAGFAEPRRITAEELRPLLDAGAAVLVDVRGASDWDFYRAAEAIHVPMGELAARSVELPHEALIALYCT